jgi:transposase-like protein
LYKWFSKKEFGQGSFSNGKLKQTPEQERIAELERKPDAELERDILKAIGIFQNGR